MCMKKHFKRWRMAAVKNSLTLDNIVVGVKEGTRIVWFVSRNGTVKRFYIKSDMSNHNFVRNHIFLVDILNLNTSKTHSEDWFGGKVKGKQVGGSGMMYDHYYGSGHFFHDPASAFDYLRLRIESGSKTIVKTAQKIIQQYPEYVI